MFLLQSDGAMPTWTDPKFLLAAAVALIGFVAWLIRLESKVQGVEKSVDKLETSCNETYEMLEAHRNNDGKHFNQRLANEVEARQKDRMDRMQADIVEIKSMVKELAGR